MNDSEIKRQADDSRHRQVISSYRQGNIVIDTGI